MDTGRDAMLRSERGHSNHLTPWKRHAARCSGAAVISLAFGGIALLSFLKMEKQARKHQEWKKMDADLDEALADSLDASDAVAKY